MATYFHGNSEIQGGGGGDGLQTLILMNPAGAYVGYSDTQQQPPPPPGNNFVFLNSNNPGAAAPPSGGNNNFTHAPAPPPPPSHTTTQQFVGIPLAAASHHHHHHHHHDQQDISGLHAFLPRVHYNLYSPSIDLGAAREVSRVQQGLSLSLSSQQPPAYVSFRAEREVPSQPVMTTTISPTSCGEEMRLSGGSSSSASGISNGVNNGMQSVLLSSKYLKAAQELLDEVVNVGKGVKNGGNHENGKVSKEIGESSDMGAANNNSSGELLGQQIGGKESSNSKRGSELTTAERQEIQMKKAKLVNMLDEVRHHLSHHVVFFKFYYELDL